MRELGGAPEVEGEPRVSIWPAIYPRLLELVRAHRSTIVFVNSRRSAERVANRLNELAEEDIARAHHGSIAREQRLADRGSAQDRARCPRSSRPRRSSSASTWAPSTWSCRSSRPSRSPPGCSGSAAPATAWASRRPGRFFPKFRGDLLETAVVTRRMQEGEIEHTRVPRQPLDVLAQQIVAMTAMDEWDGRRRCTRRSCRAYPYRDLSRAQLEGVLDMLAGRYPSDEFAELRPRIVWDRTAGVVRGRDGAKRLAVISGGTIPDRGLYGVFMADVAAPAWASSTRRWCTRPARARCSSWARARGGSSRSPATACWSRPRRACPASCRSGRATASAGRTSWARPSARPRARAAFGPLDTLAAANLADVPGRPGAGHRGGALRPHDRDRALPRRAGRLARSACSRRSARGVHAPWALVVEARMSRAARHRCRGDVVRRRHRHPPARLRRACRPPT